MLRVVDPRFAEHALFVGRIFLRREHRPQDREKQHRAAEPEAVADGVGDAAAGRVVRNTEMIEHVGEDRSDHRAGADEGGLECIAGGMLVLAQHVADEGAERLHRDVEAGVEHPQQDRGEQQGGSKRHHQQGKRGEDRATEEIGAAAAQPAEPGTVGQMPDDRLDEQAGQRRGDPQYRQVVEARSERLEDAAHVRVLEGEADLNAEKSERDVLQAGERLARFVRRGVQHGEFSPAFLTLAEHSRDANAVCHIVAMQRIRILA